jgi:hypothetical protein
MDDDLATVTLSFLDLPFELQLMIIEHLSPQDLCRSLAPVCKELNALHANPHLWLRLFKQLLASPRLAVTRPPDGDAAFGDDDEEEMALARDEEDEGHARALLASMAPPSSSPLPQLSIADIADDEGTATKRQPEFGDAWLLHARCIVNQALREGLAIDWKQEFLQRAVRTPSAHQFCPSTDAVVVLVCCGVRVCVACVRVCVACVRAVLLGANHGAPLCASGLRVPV